MSGAYRIQTDLQTFTTVGRLEKMEDAYLLLCSATTDQAFAVEQMVLAKKPVLIFALAGDEVVLPAVSRRVKARPNGARVELACLLG